MKKLFLTANGRILVMDNEEKNYFITPAGVFERFVGKEEVKYLIGILPEIKISGEGPQISFPKEFPLWKLLWQTKYQDDSNYHPDRSQNGGCYSSTIYNYYFGRLRNGRLETLCLQKVYAGGEFQTTSDGSYQNDIATLCFIDIDEATLNIVGQNDGDPTTYDVWSMSGKIKIGSEVSLSQYGEIIPLETAIEAVDGGHTSKYEEVRGEEEEYEEYFFNLSLEEKNSRKERLKNLFGENWVSFPKKGRRRG